MEYKFLSLVIFIFAPLIPMLFILCPLFPNNVVVIRRFSKWFAGLHFIYALCFMLCFNPNLLSMSYQQQIPILGSEWMKTLGSSVTFAVDGLSLLLCVLTSFIIFISLIVSKYAITSKHKIYYSLIFLLETSLLGVYCSKDIFIFILFWLLEIVPVYFLIFLWGNEKKEKYSTKYLLYNFIGGMFILFGLLVLYYYSFTVSGVLTANMESLSFDEYINPILFQILTFICLFLGFAVKFPIMPLHNWYTDAQKISPMPINMLLTVSSLCMGAYGFLRFNMQIFPTAFKTLSVLLMCLAIINIIGGAMIAFVKKNIKYVISYGYVSMSGFVLFGLTTSTEIGISGAIFLIFSSCLIFSALFMVAGIIYLRTKTLNIDELGGIGRNMPKLMYFSFLICLAVMGLPFLISFPAIFMVITGAFTTELFDQVIFQFGAIFVIFSLLMITAYILRFLHKIFYGNILTQFSKIKDTSISEFVAVTMIAIPIVIFGIVPMSLLNLYSNVTSVIVDILGI